MPPITAAPARPRPAPPGASVFAWLRAFALALVLAWPGLSARAAELAPGTYWWYVPEHEKHVRTQFYAEPRFEARTVGINRTERFRLVGGSRGWLQLEFDSGVKAYIYNRMLRILIYDPTASDPWAEFQRASVFPEEPERIAARLKREPVEPHRADSRMPIWKRYKESWGVHKGRSQPAATGDPGQPDTGLALERKMRGKYPLLPPLSPLSQPGQEAAPPEPDGERGKEAVTP